MDFMLKASTSNLSAEQAIKEIEVIATVERDVLGKYTRSRFSIPLYADTLLRAVHEDLQTVNNLLKALNIDLAEEKS
mgnify:CR=1 FL=1